MEPFTPLKTIRFSSLILIGLSLCLAGCGGSGAGDGGEGTETGEPPCSIDEECANGNICAEGVCAPDDGPPPVALEPLLGFGGSVPAGAALFTILDKALKSPGDLAFNPDAPDELWVTSQDDDALVVITHPGEDDWSGYKTKALGQHFLHEVIAISFGDTQTFGTCGESRNEEDAESFNFMGPVLWPTDIDKFPAEGKTCDGVHLDMLHDTPLCMGIAAETANAFYVFNGLDGVIDWYDFLVPHEPGGDDHSDGIKRRYQGIGLKRAVGVPSNLVLDKESGWLYIADSGNGRVIRLDTASGNEQGTIPHYEDEQPLVVIQGAVVEDVTPTGASDLLMPSGLALFDGLLYVSDHATGILYAVTLTGEPVTQLDTGLGPGTLAGITVGPDERLYLVDRAGGRVLRVDAPESP
jgi:DNA-binding beta-propeller fold protein YncE